jgi:hypothetical protein
VAGPLRGDGEAVELARQADREVADVDHLLNFAKALLQDLAGLQADQPAERLLVLAQHLAEQPTSSPRRGGGTRRQTRKAWCARSTAAATWVGVADGTRPKTRPSIGERASMSPEASRSGERPNVPNVRSDSTRESNESMIASIMLAVIARSEATKQSSASWAVWIAPRLRRLAMTKKYQPSKSAFAALNRSTPSAIVLGCLAKQRRMTLVAALSS